MEDAVLMPRELTAENGAKAIFMGEFSVIVYDDCIYCDGTGTLDAHGHEICDECNGEQTYKRKIDIDWSTIKEIYKMAVGRLAIEK